MTVKVGENQIDLTRKTKKNAKISRLEIITGLHPCTYSKINAS